MNEDLTIFVFTLSQLRESHERFSQRVGYGRGESNVSRIVEFLKSPEAAKLRLTQPLNAAPVSHTQFITYGTARAATDIDDAGQLI